MKYGKLWALCEEHDIVKSRLFKKCGLSSQTLQLMIHNESVSLSTIDKLCTYFNCQPSDIMELSVNELPSDSQSD